MKESVRKLITPKLLITLLALIILVLIGLWLWAGLAARSYQNQLSGYVQGLDAKQASSADGYHGLAAVPLGRQFNPTYKKAAQTDAAYSYLSDQLRASYPVDSQADTAYAHQMQTIYMNRYEHYMDAFVSDKGPKTSQNTRQFLAATKWFQQATRQTSQQAYDQAAKLQAPAYDRLIQQDYLKLLKTDIKLHDDYLAELDQAQPGKADYAGWNRKLQAADLDINAVASTLAQHRRIRDDYRRQLIDVMRQRADQGLDGAAAAKATAAQVQLRLSVPVSYKDKRYKAEVEYMRLVVRDLAADLGDQAAVYQERLHRVSGLVDAYLNGQLTGNGSEDARADMDKLLVIQSMGDQADQADSDNYGPAIATANQQAQAVEGLNLPAYMAPQQKQLADDYRKLAQLLQTVQDESDPFGKFARLQDVLDHYNSLHADMTALAKALDNETQLKQDTQKAIDALAS